MKFSVSSLLLTSLFLLTTACAGAKPETGVGYRHDPAIGRVEILTVPLGPAVRLRSATYTPSGKVLIAYYPDASENIRQLSLAVMDDDGENLRTFFSQLIPERDKDNGLRFMVFPDNRRIFLGDFVLECAPDIDSCDRSALLPVQYPAEVAGGDHISHRWSEIITAPDNEHIAWTTLFSNYSAAVFTGKLEKGARAYTIGSTRIVSTMEPFQPDPHHTDGVIPNPVRNGEVKQFVNGGAGISMVGASESDLADSVVQDLHSGNITQVTRNPGYDETTIFSPDERLGIVMTSRFSEATDLKILGLMPKPYPASLNLGLNMHAYTYAVTGVRKVRGGNIGPALIDIEASSTREDYPGINLHTQEEWVFRSPMSWHPSGQKVMWMEEPRGASRLEGKRRIQVARLLDYQPGPQVATGVTPDDMPYAATDLSMIQGLLQRSRDVDVKVYGKHSGYIHYRRDASGTIEKIYIDFSDDGQNVYNGSETNRLNPRSNSTYTARVTLSGPEPGVMDLQVTFGPLRGELPSRLIFDPDESGTPLSRGYTEYGGQRLEVRALAE